VQETFTRALARPRVLSGEDELYYLMRVLRNTFLSGLPHSSVYRAGLACFHGRFRAAAATKPNNRWE
jgi:hypothetical protein